MDTSTQLVDSIPKELPSPPFINLPGIANLRDIGGYASTSGRSVRRGLVFRSADTSSLPRSAESCAYLTETMGVKTVFDLRSGNEVQKAAFGPALELPGVERIHAPAIDEDMSPENISMRYKDYAWGGDAGFVRAYAAILDNCAPAVTTIARRLLQRPVEPLVIHCTAGKDRTGIVVMLLLGLAGCSAATIAREYALTTQGLAGIRERMVARLLERPEVRGDHEAVERMAGSRASAMRETQVYFAEKYGDAASYLSKQCGLGDDDISRLRHLLTSDEEPIFAEQ